MTTKKILILGMLLTLTSTAPGFCGNTNDDLTNDLVSSTKLTASLSNEADLVDSTKLTASSKEMTSENEPVKKTWGQWAYDAGKTAADTSFWAVDQTKKVGLKAVSYTGNVAAYAPSWVLDTTQNTGRYALAYAAGYYGQDVAAHVAAFAVAGIASPVVGPVAAQGIHDVILATYRLAKILPGFDGAVAYAATPYVKSFITDPAISYAPKVVEKAYSLGSYLSSWVY